MINIEILKDASEIVHYNVPDLHFSVNLNHLSDYPNMTALCHWHDDFEFIRIIRGNMHYFVNGISYELKEGDAFFINSKQMHYGYSPNKSECKFICIMVHPEIICSDKNIIKKYITPLMSAAKIPCFYFDRQNTFHKEIIKYFDDLYKAKHSNDKTFELSLLCLITELIYKVYSLFSNNIFESATSYIDPDLDSQKRMVQYIYSNYSTKLTIQNIADAGNVCRSRCCKIFNHYLGKTPNSFLNSYRLEIATKLLTDLTLSITDISYCCGFSSPSYFSEIFLQYKGCTPTSYRNSYGKPN